MLRIRCGLQIYCKLYNKSTVNRSRLIEFRHNGELQTGNESVPKIVINDTINQFFKLQSAFCQCQTITVSECCFTKIASVYFIRKAYLYFSAGNGQPREPSNCIGALSFPMSGRDILTRRVTRMKERKSSISGSFQHGVTLLARASAAANANMSRRDQWSLQ